MTEYVRDLDMSAADGDNKGSASEILGIDYVSIPVDRLEEGIEFYRDVLGLELRYVIPARWAEFGVGAFILALYPGEDEKRRGGEIAFLVDDLHVAVDRLAARGVRFPHGTEEYETPKSKGLLARFRDPSDNKLELVERF